MMAGGDRAVAESVTLDGPGIVEWARRAQAGDMAVYAHGDIPPRPVAAVAYTLHEQGLVDLTRRREASGVWSFIVQRRAKAFGHAPNRRSARHYGRATAEAVILRMIREAIRLRQPCPTNAEFAAAAGLSGRVAASYRLRRLVAAGKINLLDYGPFEHRVAVLVETGQATVRARL